jgi:hypothetical protein
MRVFAAILMLVALPMIAAAEDVTPKEQAACKADAIKYCATALKLCPGVLCKPVVGVCMIAHRDKLKPQCRMVLRAHGA